MRKIPFFSIEKRIEKWIEETDGNSVLERIKDDTLFIDLHPMRAKFILLSAARVFSKMNPETSLYVIELAKKSGFEDEGFLRIGAKSKERLGLIEDALKILEHCKQPSSISLITRMQELKTVLEDGLNLDSLGDLSEGYVGNGTILYNVHSSLPYQISGYTIRTSQIVNNLKRMGFEINVNSRWGFPTDRYDYTGSEVIERESIIEGIPHFFSPDPVGIRKNKLGGYSIEAAKSIVEHAKRTGASVIHSASDYSIGLSSAMAARSLKLPFIYEMRGLWAISKLVTEPNFEYTTEFKIAMRLEKQCASAADTVLVISEKLKAILIGWGIDEKKIIVVPNGADFSKEIIEETQAISSVLRLGYLGSVVDYEGLDILIEASKIVERRYPGRISIDIFGDGKAREELEKISDSCEFNRIKFHGKISPEEVDEAYSKLDVVVIPRKSSQVTELVPALKPIEAMSKSKLVLCSDISPHREIFQHGINGLMFENGSADSLASAVNKILSDPHKIADIRNNGMKWAIENRSWEKVLNPVRKEYLKYEIVRIVDSRLPPTKEIIGKLSEIMGEGDYSLNEFEEEFMSIKSLCSSDRERKNLFLASLRYIGNLSSDRGVVFGKKFVNDFGDRRSIRSLVTYLSRLGDKVSIVGLVNEFEEILDDEWVRDILSIHQESYSNRDLVDYRGEYYKSCGFGFDREMSDILVYADSTLNLIDGSSIWIQALSLCLAERSRNVTVLCKDNLTNHQLSGQLINDSRIKLVQPKILATKRQSIQV